MTDQNVQPFPNSPILRGCSPFPEMKKGARLAHSLKLVSGSGFLTPIDASPKPLDATKHLQTNLRRTTGGICEDNGVELGVQVVGWGVWEEIGRRRTLSYTYCFPITATASLSPLSVSYHSRIFTLSYCLLSSSPLSRRVSRLSHPSLLGAYGCCCSLVC